MIQNKGEYYLLNENSAIPICTRNSEIITFTSKELAEEFNKQSWELVKNDMDPEDKDDVVVKKFENEKWEKEWKYITIKDKKDFNKALKEFE